MPSIKAALSKPFAKLIAKRINKWASHPIETQEKIFQRLITHSDLDINVQDKDGVTPIRLAVCECIVPAVLALLQMGADPNIKDSHGISAVDEAKQAGYDGMLFFFELFKKEE